MIRPICKHPDCNDEVFSLITGAKLPKLELSLDVEVPYNYCDFHAETAEDGEYNLDLAEGFKSYYDYDFNAHMYCDSCGTNGKDFPSNLCVDCKAYNENNT